MLDLAIAFYDDEHRPWDESSLKIALCFKSLEFWCILNCGMHIIIYNMTLYSYPVCLVLEVALCFRAASVSCGLFEQYYGIRTNHDHNNNINILVDSARG